MNEPNQPVRWRSFWRSSEGFLGAWVEVTMWLLAALGFLFAATSVLLGGERR